MTRERMVVAMSGGVDSAVAAARCVAAGYDVVGISLRLTPGGAGGCCSLDDFLDARAVADALGFPHYVFDFTAAFEARVVAPFVADYLAGRTPNPCTRCNEHVKFDLLWQRARELGATTLATGHYARIGRDPDGRPVLRAARDLAKDQSYFLFTLGAAELARTRFPVGDSTKAEVRDEARRLGLPVADKPESMEVCFVPGGDAAAFVAGRAAPGALRPGAIVGDHGAVLGAHDGIHRFTVGQRRGLGVGGGPRRYVRHIDAGTGTVTVGTVATLRSAGLRARDVRWSAGTPPPVGTAVGVRIRHRHPLVSATVAACAGDEARVAFDEDGPLVTPGQAAVFYRGDVVVGGGWIVEGLAA